MTNILAVIVAYKNPQLSLKAARSVTRQYNVESRVVLWENFSTEANRAVIMQAHPHVTLVCDPENSLWTPAINKAVDRFLTDEEFILTMNNDCELPPTTLTRLVEALNFYPDAGAVGPMIPAIGGPNEPNNRSGHSTPFRVPFLMGACTLIRRTVWDELVYKDGYGLDPNMPLGADDHDLAIRMKHYGHSLYVDPRIVIMHRGHATDGSPEWDHYGNLSWEHFNAKYKDYFASEQEAVRAHWGGTFWEDCTIGTGWAPGEFSLRMRGIDA